MNAPHDTDLMKRPMAIKVLNPRLLDHPTALARFYQEVEAAAQLAHVNIVAACDAAQAGHLHRLVMELVEGGVPGASAGKPETVADRSGLRVHLASGPGPSARF